MSDTPKKRNTFYAGFWKRFLAVIIDTFMILTPITVLVGVIYGYDALKHPDQYPEAGWFQSALYAFIIIVFWLRSGQTPGKRALGLRVVSVKGLRLVTPFQAVLRYLGYFLSLVSIVGFFLPLFREDKRALHDLIAGTLVISDPEGRALKLNKKDEATDKEA